MKNLCDNAKNCDYEIIGKSYLGKNIYLFKIGNTNGGRVLMDGSMHGWEDSGTEIMYHFTKWLLNASDERARRIMAKNYVLFIPIVNVDSANRQTMKRINPDGKAICCGVDINRNFCAGFGQSGSSNTTKGWPTTYRGPYCASESETQAVIKAMKDYKPDVYVNWHMGDGKRWAGCSKDENTYNNMIALYDKYRTEYKVDYRYPIGSYSATCSGGQAIAEGLAQGAKMALLTETVETDYLPDNAQMFDDQYYMKNFPMMLALFESVECQDCKYSRVGEIITYIIIGALVVGIIVVGNYLYKKKR